MVLSEPRFVIAQSIHMFDQLKIPFETQRRVFTDRVNGRNESTETQLVSLLS